MSRAEMIRSTLVRASLAAAVSLVAAFGFGSPDPHLDGSLLPLGCSACHAGHGDSHAPMLPSTQRNVCLSCHGSEATSAAAVHDGYLSSSAHPTLMAEVWSRVWVHPLTESGHSRHDVGAVTCTSCHSPHRAMSPDRHAAVGQKLPSPRDPNRFEYELCEECHGSQPNGGGIDVARHLDPANASFHPVHAPTFTRSPSVVPELSGLEINCTDCHGNDDPSGPLGPHGSNVPGLLVASYTATDGGQEGAETYALCYRCHDRSIVLSEKSTFPLHVEHVVEEKASCATCHDAHGSVTNRALIRFGAETAGSVVQPAPGGRLEFVSDSPGSGSCWLTCHGVVHDGEAYGLAVIAPSAEQSRNRRGRDPIPGGLTERPTTKRDPKR